MDLVSALQRFLTEIRRRRMFRAAAVYLAVAFVILQLGDLVVEPLSLPAWTMTLLIVITAVGFILTLVLAWAFDLTPDGVQRTAPAATERSAGAADDPGPRPAGPARRRTLGTPGRIGCHDAGPCAIRAAVEYARRRFEGAVVLRSWRSELASLYPGGARSGSTPADFTVRARLSQEWPGSAPLPGSNRRLPLDEMDTASLRATTGGAVADGCRPRAAAA
jgi:hypothetical protein